MRLNRYLAHATGISRREADQMVRDDRVRVNETAPTLGQQITESDVVKLDGQIVKPAAPTTIMLHKPPGYVTSRSRQGKDPTVYQLLPDHLHTLKPIGRLDKDTRGLLLLTSDGELAQSLTHPKYRKIKQYEVRLSRKLTTSELDRLESGIELEDGLSELDIKPRPGDSPVYRVRMHEGRNRQIRRTFSKINHEVIDLFRTRFGNHNLGNLKEGSWKEVNTNNPSRGHTADTEEPSK